MASPFGPAGETTPEPRGEIQGVVRYHRWIIFALALHLGLGVLRVFTVMATDTETFMSLFMHPIALAVGYAIFAFSLVAIFMLTWKLSNVYVAIACVLLVGVPNPYSHWFYLPMMVLLYLIANRTLRQWGFRIGLFGTVTNR